MSDSGEETDDVFKRVLGDLDETPGGTFYEENSLVTLPLICVPGVILFPEQILPLRLKMPNIINQIKACIDAERVFAFVPIKQDYPASLAGQSGIRNILANIGTTAQIIGYSEEKHDRNENTEIHFPMRTNYLGIKSKGHQRFKLIKSWVNIDNTLSAQVKILPEICDADPLSYIRPKSWDHLTFKNHNSLPKCVPLSQLLEDLSQDRPGTSSGFCVKEDPINIPEKSSSSYETPPETNGLDRNAMTLSEILGDQVNSIPEVLSTPNFSDTLFAQTYASPLFVQSSAPSLPLDNSETIYTNNESNDEETMGNNAAVNMELNDLMTDELINADLDRRRRRIYRRLLSFVVSRRVNEARLNAGPRLDRNLLRPSVLLQNDFEITSRNELQTWRRRIRRKLEKLHSALRDNRKYDLSTYGHGEEELSEPESFHENRASLVRSQVISLKPIKRASTFLTHWPAFVYKQYDTKCLVQALIKEIFRNWKSIAKTSTRIPTEPFRLFCWVNKCVPIDYEPCLKLLEIDNVVSRLRAQWDILRSYDDFACKYCGTTIFNRNDVFNPPHRPAKATFVNPSDKAYEFVTINRIQNTRVDNEWSDDFTWFAGYSWAVLHCRECQNFLGWAFHADTCSSKRSSLRDGRSLLNRIPMFRRFSSPPHPNASPKAKVNAAELEKYATCPQKLSEVDQQPTSSKEKGEETTHCMETNAYLIPKAMRAKPPELFYAIIRTSMKSCPAKVGDERQSFGYSPETSSDSTSRGNSEDEPGGEYPPDLYDSNDEPI